MTAGVLLTPEELNRLILARAAKLNLADGFAAHFRRTHGFVTARVRELAPLWARTASEATYFGELAKGSSVNAAILVQILERLAGIERAVEAEALRGPTQ